MARCLLTIVAVIGVFFRSRTDIALEILALRQQVAVLKRKQARPTIHLLDRFFWTTLRHLWPRWRDVLLVVKPATVLPGTAPVFVCTGVGVPVLAGVVRESPRKCGNSLNGW